MPSAPSSSSPAKRTCFTPEQRAVLMQVAKVMPNPSRKMRFELAAQLELPPRVIQVHFQNFRQKVKKCGYPQETLVEVAVQQQCTPSPQARSTCDAARLRHPILAAELNAVEALLWLGTHGRVPSF